MAVRVSSAVLVGRDNELRSTRAALGALRDGVPGVVTVRGPAGVGKTRFVRELADELRADGALVASGACLDLGAGAPPYSALIAAFRSVDPPAVQLLDALTGAVGMRRARLFELLRTTVVALARRRLTVLVIEDLHWLDRITGDALVYLVALVREGRLALVVTYREDELAKRPSGREVLHSLSRDALGHVILSALSQSAVAAQMRAIVNRPVSDELAALVHRRTGGIPLLVEEVLAAEMAGIGGVPEHLRHPFLARVRGLGDPAARVAEVVAVAGDRCSEQFISDVLRADRATVGEALDRAAGADVLVADRTGYRMRHDLLREALYDAVPAGRRRRLHRRIAAALAAASVPDPAAVAYHWHAAGESTRAALANLEAAALADRVHAPAEVHTYLERVLEHFDGLPPEQATAVGGRGALLARAAEAAYLSGQFARAVTLSRLSLQEAGEPWLLAMRAERLARYCWVSRDGAGLQEAQELSIALLTGAAPARARARVLSGYSWHQAMAGRDEEARASSQRALEAAEAGDEPLERCRALLAWGYARSHEQQGLAALREARELAVACDVGDELARAHIALHLSLRDLGRPAETEHVIREGLRYVATHGMSKSYAGAIHYLLADLLLDTGRWAEAEQLLEASVANGVQGVTATFTYAYLARLAAARGQVDAVRSCADRVAALAEDLPQQPLPLAIALSARAESCVWSEQSRTALRHAERASSTAIDPSVQAEADALRVRAFADLAEQARLHGRSVLSPPATDGWDAATELDTPNLRVRAFAATILAERSRYGGRRDPAPWRNAVSTWDHAADPYHGAYCRWRLAHALLATRAGRGEAARALQEARSVAVRLGAGPLREATERLALASRIHVGVGTGSEAPARAQAASAWGLTYREQEILPLLVAGRTNAEIAQALVISPRTVGVHVSRILRKLGAARRTEAADIARRSGAVR